MQVFMLPARYNEAEVASILLSTVQLLRPVVLLGVLIISGLFTAFLWLGRRVSGIEEPKDREETFDGKGEADEAPDKPAYYPRRAVLLLLLNILAAIYALEGVLVLVDAVFVRRGHVQMQDFAASLASSAAFTLAVLTLILDAKPESTGSALIKGFIAATLLLALVELGAQIAFVVLSGVRNRVQILRLVANCLLAVVSILLALAFLPRFGMPASPSNAYDTDEDREPLLGHDEDSDEEDEDGSSEDGKNEAHSGSKWDKYGDDDDGEDESDILRAYDLVAIMHRVWRLLPLIAPLRSRSVKAVVVFCVILTLLQNISSVLVPRQLGFIVGDLNEGRSPYANIVYWILLEVIVADRFAGLFGVARRALWKPIELRSSRGLTLFSFSHVLGLSARYHNDRNTGELMSVLGRTEMTAEFLDFVIFQLAPVLIDMVVGATYFGIVYGWRLLCVLGGTCAVYIVVTILARPRLLALQAAAKDRQDKNAGLQNEAISQVEMVRYMAAESYEMFRLEKAVSSTQSVALDETIYSLSIEFNQFLVIHLGMLVSVAVVARQITLGEQSIGSFVTFTAYVQQLLALVEQLGWMSNWTNHLMTNTQKLMDVLNQQNEIVDKVDAVELEDCQGDLAFENVSFAYDPQGHGSKKAVRQALDGVSFTVKSGERIALVGETGSGKSTIFRLLFRFFDVQGGSVKIDGKDVRDYTQRSVRKALGVVQQEAAIFNDTIMENIRYGDITASDADVMKAARAAKIHERITEFPNQYKTKVGERGAKLSGGEKQRVSIARAILKNANVLLLDEATSALDSGTEREIQAQLHGLTQGKTTISIAHRLSTIMASDKIIVLHKGKIVESGHHAELVKIENGHYRKLWEAQTA